MRRRGTSGNSRETHGSYYAHLFFAQRKTPPLLAGFGYKALAMTYSCMRMHTTIGAAAFHFRVRNGIGWCHSAIVTRERVEGRGSIEGIDRAHALKGWDVASDFASCEAVNRETNATDVLSRIRRLEVIW